MISPAPIAVVPLATYYMIMSITPGPNNVMLTTSGATFGFGRTVPHVSGIVSGCATQTFLLCIGFGVVFTYFPWLQGILKWCGAAYLIYLAYKLVGAKVAKATAVTKPLTFFNAAFFQVVNPKAWVKAVTTATLFLPPGTSAWSAGIRIFTVCALMNFISGSIWTSFGVGIGKLLTNESRLRVFNASMALLLVGTAIIVIV
ncbi:LysE family translocator [Trinickia acidisoli]|uniref:LysE family translocator n=1 Tax=Trinickia acidisoli TaxID=2767482 RepID=UPI001A8DFDC2|nr:LysE family translocator [Trinickia acidisoli]